MTDWNYQTQYGVYRTNRFCEIFPDKESFRQEYLNVDLGGFTKDDTINKLYVLLYARHGNDAIISSDENRFKYALFSIVYEYGPDFEKRKEIHDRIRALSDEEIERGTTAIYNVGQNPSTSPGTQEFEQLKKIDQQSATGYKLPKIDYLLKQEEALKAGYIDVFLKRFDKLFNPFPAEYPLIYHVEGEEADD